jgi:hypothetical protein
MLTQPEELTFECDLKWSLWSQDEEHWKGYCRRGDVWGAMKAAFLGEGPPVTVFTAPRKEIRYGRVYVTEGGATGYFRTEWDEPHCLADTLGLTDGMDDEEWELWLNGGVGSEYMAFVESLPFNEYSCNGEPGLVVDFEHYADTFEELMKLVDESEDAVTQKSKKFWNELCDMYNKPEMKDT